MAALTTSPALPAQAETWRNAVEDKGKHGATASSFRSAGALIEDLVDPGEDCGIERSSHRRGKGVCGLGKACA